MQRLMLSFILLIAGCAAPAATSTGIGVTSLLLDEQAARQHCLMMLQPFIPPGTPALDSRLLAAPDAPNGEKVLRLPYTYGSTKVRMETRCQYALEPDGRWRFSRLVLVPRYPAAQP